MVQIDSTYWYGVTATVYLVTCWVFSVVRGVHNCGTPKERRAYIWPDRKMQVIIYLCGTVLLPYVLNPQNEAAWILMKSYFPCTYYFYCGALIFCFFGTVKQWKVWKKANAIAATITFLAMAPLVVNARWPSGQLLSQQFLEAWNIVVIVVSISMIGYASVAMWQVREWIKKARELNYSNPDDFPTEYAHRMWLTPIILTPFLWPAFITNSPTVMAFLCIPLAIFNITLLLNVMPVWRRAAILTDDDEDEEAEDNDDEELAEERSNRIAAEIELFVNTEAAYLDSHLKLEQVVERCNFSRRYVSKVFTERFGGFSDYVNGLRLNYFEHYKAQHPNSTDESAAEASGFTSYKSYLNAKERLPQK